MRPDSNPMHRVHLILAVGLLLAPALGAQPPEPAAPPALALVDGTLIDPGRGVEAEGMTVLIEGERVKDVFPTGSRPLPPGSRVWDLGGRFVLPGLIDSHTHLSRLFRESPERMYVELARMLHGGVVAIRDMAGDARMLAHVADRSAAAEIPAPDVFYSAVFGSPHFAQNDPRMARAGRGFPRGEAAWAQAITVETDLERAVVRAGALGVTGLKSYLGLDAALLERLTEAAHREGLRVWAHATVFPTRPLDVVRAGVDSISHACGLAWQDADLDPTRYAEVSVLNRPRFDPEAVDPKGPEMQALFEEMARRGTILDVTLSVHAFPNDDAYGCTTDLTVALARAAAEVGVPFVTGTDYAAPEEDPFPAVHLEIETLVDQGVLTVREALTAATLNGARVLGMEERYGTIEPGKLASFVILRDDPRQDVRALRSVTEVVKRGRIHPRSEYRP